jgi:hypothetical protein
MSAQRLQNQKLSDGSDIEVTASAAPDGSYVVQYELRHATGTTETVQMLVASRGTGISPSFVIYAARHFLQMSEAAHNIGNTTVPDQSKFN